MSESAKKKALPAKIGLSNQRRGELNCLATLVHYVTPPIAAKSGVSPTFVPVLSTKSFRHNEVSPGTNMLREEGDTFLMTRLGSLRRDFANDD
jgi:hypothetical protein